MTDRPAGFRPTCAHRCSTPCIRPIEVVLTTREQTFRRPSWRRRRSSMATTYRTPDAERRDVHIPCGHRVPAGPMSPGWMRPAILSWPARGMSVAAVRFDEGPVDIPALRRWLVRSGRIERLLPSPGARGQTESGPPDASRSARLAFNCTSRTRSARADRSAVRRSSPFNCSMASDHARRGRQSLAVGARASGFAWIAETQPFVAIFHILSLYETPSKVAP